MSDTFSSFVRQIPDRAVRYVIESRDEIEAEARACQRTQSWSPRSTRSAWYGELFAVVAAIDALREAVEAEDEDAEESSPERLEAYDALEEAIEAANDEARRLAGVVAEQEAEHGRDVMLREANDAANDDAWQAEIGTRLDDSDGDDHGWTLSRAEDGTLVVTGWASTRVVMGESGIVLGDEPSDTMEHEIRGRVVFQITRDVDGSDEPEGRCATIAEAVETIEALAVSHGVTDGWEFWSVAARWVEAVAP